MLSDVTWKAEQLITRGRIQAAQARVWMQWGLGLWLLSTAVVLVVSLNPVQTKHFMTWLIASGTALLPVKSIGWQGQRYAPVVLRDWFNANIYHAPLSTWLLWSALVAVVPVTIIGLLVWRHLRKKEPKETHIRGAQILSVAELSKRLRKAGPAGINIGPIAIPEEEQRSHILLIGSTGVGKTQTKARMLEQVAARGQRAAVFDPEGELTSWFYDASRGDVLFNPFDARWQGWALCGECLRREEIENLAVSLFPITPRMEGSNAEYFRRTGRLVFRDLMEHLPSKDPRLIPQLLSRPSDLLDVLKGTEAAAELNVGKREQQQILSGLRVATASFRYLEPGGAPWTARTWVPDGRGWIFFTYTRMQKAAVLPLISLGIDALGAQFLSSPLNSEQTIWLFIDEVISLHPATLPELLRQVRKRGVAIVTSIQDRAGLIPPYGEADTDSILNAPGTKFFMRTNDIETREWCAKNIGKRDYMTKRESETVGSENMRDSINRTPQLVQNSDVVTPAELLQLNRGEGYLSVGSHGTAKIQVPYAPIQERAAAFVARAETEEPEQEEARPVRRVSTERRAL